jgi:hypothetical protein
MNFKNLEIEIREDQFFDAILFPFFFPRREQADAFLKVYTLQIALEAVFKVKIFSCHLILR